MPCLAGPHCCALLFQDSHVTIWDSTRRLDLTTLELEDLIERSIDRDGVVFFADQTNENAHKSIAADVGLLGLFAAATSASGNDAAGVDTSQVHVEADLHRILAAEVALTVSCASAHTSRGQPAPRSQSQNPVTCPLCPCKTFKNNYHARGRRLTHLRRKRTRDAKAGPFLASCRLQWKLIRALLDCRRMSGKEHRRLLSPSAAALQKAVLGSNITAKNTDIDRHVRVVLCGQGPVLPPVNSVLFTDARRLSEIISYTRVFATMVLRQLLLARGRLRQTRHALVGDALDRGNTWANMMPQNRRTWKRLEEDLWSVPYTSQILVNALNECTRHQEFLHLSLDCTVRVLRRVVGQEDFNRPLLARMGAPIPDQDPLRRALMVLGRTSALLLVDCLSAETATNIAESMRKSLTLDQRLQCLFVNSDKPSGRMFFLLQAVLPNLSILAADPINYE